jgi:circadian clock protein KaiC
MATDFGTERRQLRVFKMRGKQYRGGVNDFVIRRGGIEVFPRLIAAEQKVTQTEGDLSTGIAELDHLLGGGLPRASSTLFMGAAGTGKSSVAIQFCIAAMQRGERVAAFIFDETLEMVKRRCRGLGSPLEPWLDRGLMSCRQIDPAELSPGEFAGLVQDAVAGKDADGRPATVLLIDSLTGYLNSMAQEKQLTAQLHELFTFLNNAGVSTLVTVAQSGVLGTVQAPIDTTYLADNVLLFRFFETFGRVRRAISMVKKRTGGHEQTIRELQLTPEGLQVGPMLKDFQGVLTGIPTFHGRREDLMGQS